MVSLLQARQFCAWIGRRLPTRAELTAANSEGSKVMYLLDERGKEWTSTKSRYGAFVLIGHRRAGKPPVSGAVQTEFDRDLSFRCARSPRSG